MTKCQILGQLKKITNRQMFRLDQIVKENPGISARRALKKRLVYELQFELLEII